MIFTEPPSESEEVVEVDDDDIGELPVCWAPRALWCVLVRALCVHADTELLEKLRLKGLRAELEEAQKTLEQFQVRMPAHRHPAGARFAIDFFRGVENVESVEEVFRWCIIESSYLPRVFIGLALGEMS